MEGNPLYTDPRSTAFARRGTFLLVAFNVALLVAAIVFVPSFGTNDLARGVAGDKPTGAQQGSAESADIPAARALAAIAKGVDDAKVLKGWRGGRDGASLEVAPIEVSCFAKGAPATVSVRTKGWTRGGVNSSGLASESVMWSVRAYGAGQGSAWFKNLRDNANRCGVGVYTVTGLGSEAVSFTSGQVSTLAWRRGDVISTFGYQRNHQPGYTNLVRGPAEKIDAVVKSVLDGVCANTGSSNKTDHGRSPYVQAKSYTGYFVGQKFDVSPTIMQAPDGWSETGGKKITTVEPVQLPITLTRKPSGVVPISMPTTMEIPEAPKAPRKPKPTFKANEQQEDATGPGCGWAFTAQKAPTFDPAAARTAFETAVTKARSTTNQAWATWFPAMADYQDDYESYTQDVKGYDAYVEDVLTTSEAWHLIQGARDTYDKALVKYQKTVDAREAFLTKQETAKTTYNEDRQFCSTGVFEPSDPNRAEPTCPAKKPAILSQKAPAFGDKPVKPDEAKIVKDLQKQKESEQRDS